MNETITKSQTVDVPDDWKLGNLADFGVFRSGNGFPLVFQGHQSGDYPFFKVSDLSGEGNQLFMNNANHYIGEDIRRKLSAIKFGPGSIVFAKIGAAIFLERKRLLTQESCLDNNMMAFTLTDNYACPRFFHYLFQRIEIGKLVSTTALPALSGRHIGAVGVLIPPPVEQRAIAEVLSDVDGLINALDALIAKKRAIKQATMQQLLTGKTRLPGFSGEWETKRLGDVVQIKKGSMITEKDVVLGTIPVIAGGQSPAYYHNTANRTGKTITVSASGAYAGFVALYNQPIFASDCSTISENPKFSIDFIYYYLLFNNTFAKKIVE